ncbi:helix-turn-helix transcriptional regulator [Actinokineospora auranticolor]|uniref:Helix-turn-helix protein n=1 Tax=Actinokineospora auranticolor TaxID=155976 RepID=A0A2S6GSB3_9PSEU|nr:helix-turn-helix transcriptional regulator [Actinokineospora auranticolor]PPK68067.1 helix-turn-helix protein [Actinokineospora auranticolor]
MGRESEVVLARRRQLGLRLAAFRRAAGLTQAELAERLLCDRSMVAHLERGRGRGTADWWRDADKALAAGGVLVDEYGEAVAVAAEVVARGRASALAEVQAQVGAFRQVSSDPLAGDDELAWELARRVAATDVSGETVGRLERAFDGLAVDYPKASPAALLVRLRAHLGYVAGLLDKRATLDERRRLVVVGGWMSLLAATCHVDLRQRHAAGAYLRTAASLARHAGHDEIRAWCYETEAWRVLTDGDFPRALELSRSARHHAPAGSSIAIQATAQEGRALARLGDRRATARVISQVHRLVAPLPTPDAEHHYRYDPHKAVAYTATTLAWAGDPAAEAHAREIIARLAPPGDTTRWPRRAASAHLDLALALANAGRHDEACQCAVRAIESGRIVPSNLWRVTEVVDRVGPNARTPDLQDAYRRLLDNIAR